MKTFKFFTDNDGDLFEDEDDDYAGASWIWKSEDTMTRVYGNNYTISTTQCYGIRTFLAQFTPHSIISIKSITGPNGIIHNIDNEGAGWGFDIIGDFITIVYFTLNETV